MCAFRDMLSTTAADMQMENQRRSSMDLESFSSCPLVYSPDFVINYCLNVSVVIGMVGHFLLKRLAHVLWTDWCQDSLYE